MKTLILNLLAALAIASAAHAAPAAESAARTIEMQVDGLVCAFCAQGIEKKLRKQAATADVLVSLEHRLVAVALKPQQDITDDALRTLLTEAGYTLREVKRTSNSILDIRKRIGHAD